MIKRSKTKINTSKFQYFAYASMIFLLLLLFWRIRYPVFGAQEEYGLFYIVQKGDFFAWLNSISRQTGRITFYILGWFWAGPMFFSNPIVYKLSMYILITADFFCFFQLLKCHINERFAVFAVSFILITMQISNQHNLLIAYNYLHIPFILLMISMHLLLNYGKEKYSFKAVIISALLSFFASFFQENFCLFYILCFVIIFFYNKEKRLFRRIWKSLYTLRFHVIGGVVFLLIYFSFRITCSMEDYAGNTLCLSQPLASIKVLLTFISGMIPCRTFINLSKQIGVRTLLSFLTLEDLLATIVINILLCIMLHYSKCFKKSIYLYGSLLLSAILSCLLHAVSLQYITWVSSGNTYAYVPSYYASFFINTVLCLLIHSIYWKLHKKWKSGFLICFGCLMIIVSSLTISTNKYYNEYYRTEFEHYETYRSYFKTCGIENWSDSAQILINDSYPVNMNLIQQSMTTVRYDAFFFMVTQDINQIDTNRPYYILTYDNNQITLETVP